MEHIDGSTVTSDAIAAYGPLKYAFAGYMVGFLIAMAVLAVILFICQGRLFKEAGKPGWAPIVPVYNMYVMSQIALGDSYGWVGIVACLVCAVPFVGGLVGSIASLYISYLFIKSFDKDTLWCILYILFTPIVLIIIAFSGSYRYIGPQDSIFDRDASGKWNRDRGYGGSNNYNDSTDNYSSFDDYDKYN